MVRCPSQGECSNANPEAYRAGGPVLGLVAGLALVRADDPPKYTIKQVMDMAHKDSKDKTVLSIYSKLLASTDADEQKKLSAAGRSVHGPGPTKPPRCDDDDWKKRVTAIVAAAKDVAAGKDGSIDQLKKDNDCMGCHKAHRYSSRNCARQGVVSRTRADRSLRSARPISGDIVDNRSRRPVRRIIAWEAYCR